MSEKFRSLYQSVKRNRTQQDSDDTDHEINNAEASPPTDAPPAYTPTAPAASSSRAGAGATTALGDDDRFAFLCDFDTVFLIDDSASMRLDASPTARGSRWDEVAEVLRAVAPICAARDDDGLDVYFLNHRSPSSRVAPPGKAPGGYYNIRDAAAVTRMFGATRPDGYTPTGKRLEEILDAYLKRLEAAPSPKSVKSMNVIVITDGDPTDDPAGVLIEAARHLNQLNAGASQLGVQFFQVGRDARAKEALQELDDGLSKHSGRDIVDAVTWDNTSRGGPGLTAEGVLKVVLGAVSRRLDWKPMGGGR
ncbi:von Willebrand factor, type A [Akanthomyces lecanii RCEF 1005]|uniref:von Willebrand factor, type A n=1 Tax=Akanthomyces lecanii RCEF 1005 TaxID=1081108 RepID=A0A162K8E1_CORDF|nr:von Willebrand factor, type A [Akanthomyces lecanii RCEF 1005]